MTAAAGAGLDLAMLRAQLAGPAEGRQLQPIGLRRVAEGSGAIGALGGLVAELRGTGGVVVLADATPMSVTGRDLRTVVERELGRGRGAEWIVLGPPVGPEGRPAGPVHADERTVAAAVTAAAGASCVVTVGSGTISDIGKVAAGHGRTHVAVQTATSVNGFADPFSVLLHQGVKRTTPSRWPTALLIDPDVLAGAPRALNRAGLGDLMAMFTAPADWYLATAVARATGTEPADPPYQPAVAALVRAHGARLRHIAAALADDPAAGGALAELARILTLSGISMGVAGSTAPASGMEHAISHLLEMAAGARDQRPGFHGHQVGVASVVAAATWEHVRRRIGGGRMPPARLPDPEVVRGRIAAAFTGLDSGGRMAAECFDGYAGKLRRLMAGGDPLQALAGSWDQHERVLDSILIEPSELAGALRRAGLPARFRDITDLAGQPGQVDVGTARWAVANCALQRDRFCVADLAMLLGAWEEHDLDDVLDAAGVLGSQP